jgi:hypothetical protein
VRYEGDVTFTIDPVSSAALGVIIYELVDVKRQLMKVYKRVNKVEQQVVEVIRR